MALRFFRPITQLRPTTFRTHNALFAPSPFRQPVFTTTNCTFWNFIFRKKLRYVPGTVTKEPFTMVDQVIFTSEMAPLVHTAKRIGGYAVLLASVECPYLLYYMDPVIPPAAQVGFCAALFALAYVPAFYFHTYIGRFVVTMQLQLTEKGKRRRSELENNVVLRNIMAEKSITMAKYWALSDEELAALIEESVQRANEEGIEEVPFVEQSCEMRSAAHPINYDLYCLELTTHDTFGFRKHHHVAFDDLVFHCKQDEWPAVWRVRSTGRLFYIEDRDLWRLPGWIRKIMEETALEEQKLQEAQRALEEAEREKEKQNEQSEEGGEYQNYEPKRE